jgi:hypothetical protein
VKLADRMRAVSESAQVINESKRLKEAAAKDAERQAEAAKQIEPMIAKLENRVRKAAHEGSRELCVNDVYHVDSKYNDLYSSAISRWAYANGFRFENREYRPADDCPLEDSFYILW